MPQLKIQLSEWKSEPAPGYDIYGYEQKAIEHMDDRIRMLRAKPEKPEGVSGYSEWITEFISVFYPELTEILDRDREEILTALVSSGRDPELPNWKEILAGGDRAEAACRALAVNLLAIILAEKPEEPEAAEEPVAEPEPEGEPESEPESEQEPESEADAATDDENEVDEEPAPEPTAKSEIKKNQKPEKPIPIIPVEFFGRGPLPKGVSHALLTEKKVHDEWRRGVASAESILRTLGAWLEINGLHREPGFTRIGLAISEFQEFSQNVDFSSETILPQADISVPLEPPRHLLAGHPVYDNKDLTIKLAPFLADQVRPLELTEEFGAEVVDGGGSIVMADWSQTNPNDLSRLGDLFDRLRNLIRRPRSKGESRYEDEVIKGLMSDLGCIPIQNLASCWLLSGGRVVGARPVFHYRDGTFHKQMLQLSMVLGPRGGDPVPDEFTNKIIGRGAVSTWVDSGLVFVGYEIDDPDVTDGIAVEFTDFMAFADELQVNLVRTGAVENVAPDTWADKLKPLATRLEVDFERTRRQWRRLRQVDELKLQLDHESVEAARSVIGRADNEDDRNHLRAALVVLLFQREPDEALSELDKVEYGQARHEAMLAVLEAAVVSENEELLHQCFGRWLGDDALRPKYDQDCLPVFELVAAGAGLAAIHEGYSDVLSPAVRCDWLNFIFRRSPRSRHDPVWLTHMDGLTNDAEILGRQNLDRLVDLYLVARRHELPGRSALMAVIKSLAEHSPFRAYYEDRLDQPLGDNTPDEAT